MIDNMTIFIGKAIEASRNAYAPYSNFRVGALLVAKNGEQYTGCNVENASFPATICAERTALVKAVSAGIREFSMIVVATKNGGSPCGVCRQMLYEFSPEMRVVCTDFDGKITLDCTLNQLLAEGFGAQHLNK